VRPGAGDRRACVSAWLVYRSWWWFPASSGSAGRASSSPVAHGDDSHDWSLWSFPPDAADPRA
jgi:hypothetical protein